MAKKIESIPLWSWLKTISRKLHQLDAVPLLATLPFPWDVLGENLSKCFGIKSLKIEPKEMRWRDEGQVKKDISNPFLAVAASSGFEGKISLLMGASDGELLMTKLLQLEAAESASLPKDLIESFFRFICVETVSLVNNLQYDSKFSFALLSTQEELTGPQLCQDFIVSFENNKITARICLSPEFRSSLQSYAIHAHAIKPSKESLEALQFTVGVETGRTELSLQELLQVKAGDFLIIEQAIQPEKCVLTLEGKPLFFASIKNANIQILELPLYSEVYGSMVTKNPPDNTKDPEKIEENVYDENENPFEDEEDEEYETEEEDDDDDDDDFELREEEAPQEEVAPKKPVKKAEKPEEKPAATQPATAKIAKKDKLGIEDIPVTLSIELAQIQMSAEKLLNMQPGNTLDLAVTPDSAALLVVNGKIVGRGEILKIGETLGVRILELGST